MSLKFAYVCVGATPPSVKAKQRLYWDTIEQDTHALETKGRPNRVNARKLGENVRFWANSKKLGRNGKSSKL